MNKGNEMNKKAAAVISILCSAASLAFLGSLAYIHDYMRHVAHADVAMLMLGLGCFGSIVIAMTVLMLAVTK